MGFIELNVDYLNEISQQMVYDMGGTSLSANAKNKNKDGARLKSQRKEAPTSFRYEKFKETPPSVSNAPKQGPTKKDAKVSQPSTTKAQIPSLRVVTLRKDKEVVTNNFTHANIMHDNLHGGNVTPVPVSGGQPFPSGIGTHLKETFDKNQTLVSGTSMDYESSKNEHEESPHESLGTGTVNQVDNYIAMQQ